jgi:hypothetical protein
VSDALSGNDVGVSKKRKLAGSSTSLWRQQLIIH